MGRHSLLQRQSSKHQVLDPLPVPSHFPSQNVPNSMLGRDGHCCTILVMGHCQWFRQLRASSQILGPVDTRKLS